MKFLKLYIKKLFLAAAFGYCYYMLSTVALLAVLFFKVENDMLLLLFFFGICTMIFSIFVGTTRYTSNKKKIVFLSKVPTESLNFLQHILIVVKSPDFIAELLACLPVAYVVWSYMGYCDHGRESFLMPTLQSVTATAIIGIIFSLIDILIWYLVQKKWLKDNIK